MKTQYRKFTWSIVITLLLTIGLTSGVQAATTWYVDDNCTGSGDGSSGNPFCTIQDAINAASSDDDDTISVAAGTYNENVLIDKSSISLQTSEDATIAPASGAAITLRSPTGPTGMISNINIRGFYLRGASYGILIDRNMYPEDSDLNVGNLSISNMDIQDHAKEGIAILHGAQITNLSIMDSVLKNNLNGLGISGNSSTVSNMSVRKSDFSSNSNHGLYVKSAAVGNAWLNESDFTQNTYQGIHLEGAQINTIAVQQGTIGNNSGSGIVLKGNTQINALAVNRAEFSGNTQHTMLFGGNSTLGTMNLTQNTFQSNGWGADIVLGYWGTPLNITGATLIKENFFHAGGTGVYLDNVTFSDTPEIIQNAFSVGNLVNINAAPVNASGNWWGSSDAATVRNRANGAQAVDYTPWLANGTDMNTAPGFQGDFSTLHVDDDSPQVGSTGRIQEAIDLVTGSTIYVAAGTYTENVNVNTSVEIIGAGSGDDPASNTIITQTTTGAGDTKIGVVQLSASGTSGNPILLQDMRLEPVGMAGISVGRFCEKTGTSVEYVELDNVKVIGTNTNPSTEQERGLYVDLTSTLRHLTISDSAFDNLTYGWYFQKDVSADDSTVRYVTVDNTTFNHNNHKGLYAEKLSDATFTECTADGNGFDSSALPGYFAPWSAGIDINLKAGTYANLAFMACTITNNATDEAKEGVGLTVKARDDDSYSAYPATLTNVTIEDGLFSGNERGIRIGEPTKNNVGPTNVQIHYNNIAGNVQSYSGTDGYGSEYGGLLNHTQTQVHATCNWWGAEDGPAGEGRGSGDAVSSNVEFIPWLIGPAPDGSCEGYPAEGINVEKSQELEFDRGADPFTETPFVDYGDEIMYSIEVTNTFGQAVDVLVSDAMSAYVDYLADSLTIYKNGTEFDDPDKEDSISYDNTLDIFSLAYVFNSLGINETLKLEFLVQVEDLVPLGEWIENFAIVTVTIPGLTFDVQSNTVRVEVVPEPATFFLIGAGLFGIAALARRKRQQQK